MSNFRCFKYKAINKNLVDSLVNSTLYFSSRDKLNDPFDSQINLHKIIISMLKSGDLDKDTKSALVKINATNKFFENFENGYKDFGICSFSIELKNTLMWSHYADEHRGLALYYDFPTKFLDNPDEILGVSPVKYKNNSISHWLQENASYYEKDHFHFVTELLKIVITAKAPEWEYEKEGRIIRPVAGTYVIPREFLKGITFGLRTSDSDEKLIRSLADKYYEEMQFSRVVRTGDNFGIDIQDTYKKEQE